MSPRQPITVGEARKILGRKFSEMTDDEVRSLIESLDNIANLIINNYQVLKPSQLVD